MDLSFTPEEQQFREEIRAWVRENLPQEISHKVHNALELTRDDLQGWAKILGKKGWLGYGWPTAKRAPSALHWNTGSGGAADADAGAGAGAGAAQADNRTALATADSSDWVFIRAPENPRI
jgi:alkylation response protein AidB-like acyl-CoA dehydrogenase